MSIKSNNKDMNINRSWKNMNKSYLKELQSFLDKAENIENETLKKDVIFQMLKCDEILTKIAEEKFNEYYELGKKENKCHF